MLSKWMKKSEVLAVMVPAMFLGFFLGFVFHAKVISSLDTVQESFFPTSETTTEADSNYENFFYTTTQQPSTSVDTPAGSYYSRAIASYYSRAIANDRQMLDRNCDAPALVWLMWKLLKLLRLLRQVIIPLSLQSTIIITT